MSVPAGEYTVIQMQTAAGFTPAAETSVVVPEDDTIELTTLDGTHRYEVEWTKIVKPADVSVLEPTDEPALTLVTCYPFYFVGSAPERFIVRAHRIREFIPSGDGGWTSETLSTGD